ncbi:MAG: GLUG motif-containing protein, partial [archaeon]
MSLIVVALVLSSSNNSTTQLIDSSAQMSNVFGRSISASDLVIDSNGNALFKLNNLSGDNVTIKKIIVGGEESAYNDLVPSTGERMIYLADSNTNCVCQENQKNAVCVVEIVYVTREGLEKKETRNLTIDCVNTAAPSQPLQVSGLGSGTIDDPFVINSCKELQRMKDNLDWHYALGGDINCAETINWNDGLGFEPIGANGYCENENSVGCSYDEASCASCSGGICISPANTSEECWYRWDDGVCYIDDGSNPDDCSMWGGIWTSDGETIWHPSEEFIGSFNGNNHFISNLVINSGDESYVGLFGYLNGSISNIGLINVSITGFENVGGLVGYSNDGSIVNSYSTGSVT